MVEGLLDLASAFGLSTAAGLNAYIPMLTVAALAKFTHLIELQEPWSALTSWWIIALLAVLLAFFVGIVPWIGDDPTLSFPLNLIAAVGLLLGGHGAFRKIMGLHIFLYSKVSSSESYNPVW